MVALYFDMFPKEAESYYNEVIAYEEEQELDDKIYAYLNRLSKSELKDLVCDLLYNGPDWQFDNFINENIEW